MITPYRGRVIISCTVDLCKEDRAVKDVKLSCLNCALHTTEIVALDEKPVVKLETKPVREKAVKPAYESRVSDKIDSKEV